MTCLPAPSLHLSVSPPHTFGQRILHLPTLRLPTPTSSPTLTHLSATHLVRSPPDSCSTLMFHDPCRTWVFSLRALSHISPSRPTPARLVLSLPVWLRDLSQCPSHRAHSGATGRRQRRRVTIYTCAVIAAAASPASRRPPGAAQGRGTGLGAPLTSSCKLRPREVRPVRGE